MYKTIIEILSSLTPIVIGAAVVYIAWQQHQTNKNRLKMELFDRRYKVYDALITVITTRCSRFHDEIVLDLHRDISPTRFLFSSDQDILDFQKKVLSAAQKIVNFQKECGVPYFALDSGDEDRAKALGALRKALVELRQEAIEVFSKYLTLEA